MSRLYVMALYATRPAGDEPETRDYEVALRVALAVASDEDEAREKATTQLLEQCPPAEGWVNHHVSLSVMTKESLRQSLELVSDDAPDAELVDNSDWPDWIM